MFALDFLPIVNGLYKTKIRKPHANCLVPLPKVFKHNCLWDEHWHHRLMVKGLKAHKIFTRP